MIGQTLLQLALNPPLQMLSRIKPLHVRAVVGRTSDRTSHLHVLGSSLAGLLCLFECFPRRLPKQRTAKFQQSQLLPYSQQKELRYFEHRQSLTRVCAFFFYYFGYTEIFTVFYETIFSDASGPDSPQWQHYAIVSSERR